MTDLGHGTLTSWWASLTRWSTGHSPISRSIPLFLTTAILLFVCPHPIGITWFLYTSSGVTTTYVTRLKGFRLQLFGIVLVLCRFFMCDAVGDWFILHQPTKGLLYISKRLLLAPVHSSYFVFKVYPLCCLWLGVQSRVIYLAGYSLRKHKAIILFYSLGTYPLSTLISLVWTFLTMTGFSPAQLRQAISLGRRFGSFDVLMDLSFLRGVSLLTQLALIIHYTSE